MKMYEELAEEKAEKENRELRRQPRERDHAGEQRKKVERVRQREEEGKILQCNEGKWEFHFDEESVKGSIILDLHVSRRVEIKILRRVTPSTRRLLDGVAMPVPHRSTEPGRPRHRRAPDALVDLHTGLPSLGFFIN